MQNCTYTEKMPIIHRFKCLIWVFLQDFSINICYIQLINLYLQYNYSRKVYDLFNSRIFLLFDNQNHFIIQFSIDLQKKEAAFNLSPITIFKRTLASKVLRDSNILHSITELNGPGYSTLLAVLNLLIDQLFVLICHPTPLSILNGSWQNWVGRSLSGPGK